MTRDAWLDSPLARLAKIVGGFLLLIGLIFAAPDGIGLAILVLLALGAIVSLLIFPRRNATPSLEDAAPEAPHRGINISRITFAGFPGFVLVAGFVWMFWFGAPAYRPIVIVIALVGGRCAHPPGKATSRGTLNAAGPFRARSGS